MNRLTVKQLRDILEKLPDHLPVKVDQQAVIEVLKLDRKFAGQDYSVVELLLET